MDPISGEKGTVPYMNPDILLEIELDYEQMRDRKCQEVGV